MTGQDLKQAVLENARAKKTAAALIDLVVGSTRQPPPEVRKVVRKLVMSGELLLTDDRKVQTRTG